MTRLAAALLLALTLVGLCAALVTGQELQQHRCASQSCTP